jgi:hypothetical protein
MEGRGHAGHQIQYRKVQKKNVKFMKKFKKKNPKAHKKLKEKIEGWKRAEKGWQGIF